MLRGPARIRLRTSGVSLALVATLAVGTLHPTPAPAQERRGILDMLFGGKPRQARPPQRLERPEAPPRKTVRRKRADTPREATRPRKNRATAAAGAAAGGAAAAAVAAAPVSKSDTARTVLVVGDFLAGSLAKGLEDAFAQNREIRVESKADGASGLVRADHYDWVASLPSLVTDTKPAAVVVMLGANDRQAFRAPEGSLPLRGEAWSEAYEARVEALADTASASGVPLLWVGMPPFGVDRASEDMVYFNDLYRKAALRVGGEFVDVWSGFTDANGGFATSGPDLAGRTVRLRNSDGITLTPAGQTKLAYFAEKPITKRLGLNVDDLVASLGPQQLKPGELAAGAAAANATAVRPVSLADPGLDGGDQLLGGGPAQPTASASPGARLVGEGRPSTPLEGRADRFSWTGRGEAVSPVTQGNAIVFRGSTSIDQLRRDAGSPTPAAEPQGPPAPAPEPGTPHAG